MPCHPVAAPVDVRRPLEPSLSIRPYVACRISRVRLGINNVPVFCPPLPPGSFCRPCLFALSAELWPLLHSNGGSRFGSAALRQRRQRNGAGGHCVPALQTYAFALQSGCCPGLQLLEVNTEIHQSSQHFELPIELLQVACPQLQVGDGARGFSSSFGAYLG